MPQVGTARVRVTRTRSPDTDVVRHEVRLRVLGGTWPTISQAMPDADTAEYTFENVPVWSSDVQVAAEVRAVDAIGQTSSYVEPQAQKLFVIPGQDPPPRAPSNVTATIL